MKSHPKPSKLKSGTLTKTGHTKRHKATEKAPIRLWGARQHNLKNLSLSLEKGSLTVVTGVSGSGKSSLVFDTLYAEGQRRYVETFSPHARQFLDRMDRPALDGIEGIPPAIAIDQSNPVRNSRSTVGTMTELNDHLKLLFSRIGHLFDRESAQPVQDDNAQSIYATLQTLAEQEAQARLVLTFPVVLPKQSSAEEVTEWLLASGFTRTHEVPAALASQTQSTSAVQSVQVVVDRFSWSKVEQARVLEAIELALTRGHGQFNVFAVYPDGSQVLWPFCSGLHSAHSGIYYTKPLPSLFSFNSPYGACESCRGFGRVIGVDWGLVFPNPKLSLSQGAIKPFQTPAWKACQDDLQRHAPTGEISLDIPWAELSTAQQEWVLHGEVGFREGQWKKKWYGVQRFFNYLESKAYKMHIRVLLSKYRSYTQCSACGGARLQTEALLWRIGSKALADDVLPVHARCMPKGVAWKQAQLEAMPGLNIVDCMRLPLKQLREFFLRLHLEEPAFKQLLGEIRLRLHYLCEVGLDYLSLDRQSRTLSGGEVQRINLTTALGSSLVQTLFVLDEPSIGLHARDIGRILQAIKRLRDAGNTLVVVEHDPAFMEQAERVVDIGPGPGVHGGEIVFDGTPTALLQSDTLTGAYLSGRKRVHTGPARGVPTASHPCLELSDINAHNVRKLNLNIPLQRLVVLTGVSGSGKSTLLQNVLAPALLRHFGKTNTSSEDCSYGALSGGDYLADVVLVDQAPIGKSARSNPVSYIGAWDAIRNHFATSSLAGERGYRPGTFSFNSGDGRCPMCSGTGFEHIEMQFLSDVYLRCPECDGKRYRASVLEVRIERQGRSYNVADVLDLTVSQALQVFADDAKVQQALQPLVAVGLDYLCLGQPVPTLSGGEAQRLKLAAFLRQNQSKPKPRNQSRNGQALAVQKSASQGSLYLLDEPTTGLHFADIAKLLQSLQQLVDAGHSVLVIEHNLDFIGVADWLIDLGPEGGAGGGNIVAQGSPAVLLQDAKAVQVSYTLQALKKYREQQNWGALASEPMFDSVAPLWVAEASTDYAFAAPVLGQAAVEVVHAREHNLKNISVSIPRGQFNVVTGVSGSGKSTLAFDIVFNEGQRRYLETLNAYARTLVQPAGRPEVDAVYGLPPTVAIAQRQSRGGRKSTVATSTELWHFLRLLYVKLGVVHCINDGAAVLPQSEDSIVKQIARDYAGQTIAILAPLVCGRKGIYTELAQWALERGYSQLRVDNEWVSTQQFPRLSRYALHHIELPLAKVLVQPQHEKALHAAVTLALQHGKGFLQVLPQAQVGATAVADVSEVRTFSTLHACPVCQTSYPLLEPRLFSYNSKTGWCPDCVGTGVQLSKTQRKVLDDSVRDAASSTQGREHDFSEPRIDDLLDSSCLACQGSRLNPLARAVRFQGQGIAELAQCSISELYAWMQGLQLSARERAVAIDLLPEIEARLHFLQAVGLGYLSLDRGAPTLSGGEAQRIRLAAQLGSQMQGVCYVLDEPTIGLHARDNQMLLGALHKLVEQGNTLMVVEHDADTIRAADWVIDIGPNAGVQGGRVVACAKPQALMHCAESLTGRFLHKTRAARSWNGRPPEANASKLSIHKAHLHNLQNIDLDIPLQRLVALTGVSGSGKSTLARDVLLANVQTLLAHNSGRSRAEGLPAKEPTYLGCAKVEGHNALARVLEVDQTPIGKTSRSCLATYIGFWNDIRKLFAQTLEAKASGFDASRFSFNTGVGRCPVCQGLGERTLEMHFLADVRVPCEACLGQRFDPPTLGVTWRGKSIGDVLHMPVDEAAVFFTTSPRIAKPLLLLQAVGLGYLSLGQASSTLSGGEAQRIKLVAELSKAGKTFGKKASKPTLYVLDEPSVGLHMADVEKLIAVLQQLVLSGHSVLLIEHNLDLVGQADWVIDLGPEGGVGGGELVACATPPELARSNSHTGHALAQWFTGTK